jgi:hypothetical protein
MMDVIDELIAHCEAWEPWARVMGNVCAGDAAQALRSLRAENKAAWDSAEHNAKRARAAEATIERLREYARHTPACYWWSGTINQPHPCDCGYDELMAELEESKCKKY